jgi:cyclopropane fatty-acyl-phospholipid synthase-like methyltransferase
MAKTLKMKVLHPGGLDATKLLAEKCKISPDDTILDWLQVEECHLLAKKYGCRIVGIDIDLTLLKAQAEAISKRVDDRVVSADANDLSGDQTFDGAIFQAYTFTNKAKALHKVVK